MPPGKTMMQSSESRGMRVDPEMQRASQVLCSRARISLWFMVEVWLGMDGAEKVRIL